MVCQDYHRNLGTSLSSLHFFYFGVGFAGHTRDTIITYDVVGSIMMFCKIADFYGDFFNIMKVLFCAVMMA